jgi:arylamine N-acetyltransferase
MRSDLRERYLRLLGVEGSVSGLSGLERVVLRHVCRVPFENVSKLLLIGREGTGRPAALSEFLDGIEHHDLGGTCYSSNPFLVELLREVGYNADLLGADMSTPNIHSVIRVRIDGLEYHVDAGYGGPFRYPIRLDRLPHEIPHGDSRFVVDRDAGDRVQVSVLRGDTLLHGYTAHEPPRGFDFFEPIILDSFQPGRTFMSMLRIVRYFENHAVELSNTTLSTHRGVESTQIELGNLAELRSAVASDLAMPRCPVDEAAAVLERLTGQRLFRA